MLTPQEYHARITGPIGAVTTAMERHGVPFDVPAALELRERVRADELATAANLGDWCGKIGYQPKVDAKGRPGENPPNWGSWVQLQRFLYTDAGLNLLPSPYWKKGSTGYDLEGNEIREGEGELKTDDMALRWLGSTHPEHLEGLNLIRNLRWQQRVGGYLDKWTGLALYHPVRWRKGAEPWYWLHPSFGLASDRDERAGAVTGRFAVKNPALQQVPKHGDEYGLRALFKAPPGWKMIVVDYSQLEIVVLAHVAHALFGTTNLIERLQPGAPDMHSATAKYVWGEVLGDQRMIDIPVDRVKEEAGDKRDAVKEVRYGTNYCKSFRTFAVTMFDKAGRALGEEKALAMQQALFEFDPEIPRYQDWVRAFITKHREISSLYGRRVLLPDARSWERGLRNRAWRRACNYPMQSGGQEITALAMIALHSNPAFAALDAEQYLQVHDEDCALVPEDNAKEALSIMEYEMTNAVKLHAPLTAKGKVGTTWAEAK